MLQWRDIDYTGCESWTDKAAREIGVRQVKFNEHLTADEVTAIQRKHYDESLRNMRESHESENRLKMTLPEDCQDASLAMVAAKSPQAFVLHCPGRQLEKWQMEEIKKQWQKLYEGTAIAKVPIIILDKCLTKLEIVDLAPPEPPPTTSFSFQVTTDRRDRDGDILEKDGMTICPQATFRLDAAAVEMIQAGTQQPLGIMTPLRRPNRTAPLDNEELKRIAAANPPPQEWFDGEEKEPYIGLDGGVK